MPWPRRHCGAELSKESRSPASCGRALRVSAFVGAEALNRSSVEGTSPQEVLVPTTSQPAHLAMSGSSGLVDQIWRRCSGKWSQARLSPLPQWGLRACSSPSGHFIFMRRWRLEGRNPLSTCVGKRSERGRYVGSQMSSRQHAEKVSCRVAFVCMRPTRKVRALAQHGRLGRPGCGRAPCSPLQLVFPRYRASSTLSTFLPAGVTPFDRRRMPRVLALRANTVSRPVRLLLRDVPAVELDRLLPPFGAVKL